jgi:hypothetical protein
LVQAFTPALAVASDGTLGLAYLDFREDSPADPGHLWTTAWLATTGDGGSTWQEAPLGARFDLRAAPKSEGWFLGDYLGLVARGATFSSFFVMTNPGVGGNQSDVFAGRVDPASGVAAPPLRAVATEQRVTPRPLRERLRELRQQP